MRKNKEILFLTHPLTPSLIKRRGISVMPLFEERERG